MDEEDGRERRADDDSALYAHKFHTGFWNNVSNPEEFGFASKSIHPISILSYLGCDGLGSVIEVVL